MVVQLRKPLWRREKYHLRQIDINQKYFPRAYFWMNNAEQAAVSALSLCHHSETPPGEDCLQTYQSWQKWLFSSKSQDDTTTNSIHIGDNSGSLLYQISALDLKGVACFHQPPQQPQTQGFEFRAHYTLIRFELLTVLKSKLIRTFQEGDKSSAVNRSNTKASDQHTTANKEANNVRIMGEGGEKMTS